MQTNEDNAQIELQHIQLELINGRTQHFRHFVDQYYCYRHGYVNRNGNPNWEAIRFDKNVSLAAAKVGNPKMTVKEHVVPLKTITKRLTEIDPVTTAAIAELLDKMLLFATISKEEDARLRDLGLNHAMPDGFTQPGHEYHNDLWSRYKKAGIEIES